MDVYVYSIYMPLEDVERYKAKTFPDSTEHQDPENAAVFELPLMHQSRLCTARFGGFGPP